MQADYAAKVDENQYRGEGSVDEGAVDEKVYVVEPVAKDSYPYSDRNSRCPDYENRLPGPLEPGWCVYR